MLKRLGRKISFCYNYQGLCYVEVHEIKVPLNIKLDIC